ncbi:MAG: hypothetical protein MI976_11430 [Pseudomonadales bacterium]|nr:hypothetical protein [Pseudomonadales bacterium]
MRTLIYIFIAMFITPALAVKTLTPQFKHVKLQEFTSLTLDVLPDAGTQLIFPFLLDNPDLSPGLKIRLTNDDGFDVPHDAKEIEALLIGQNTISIIGKPSQNGNDTYLGNLFVSIGGYNLSIALRTTYDVRKHISNIVLNISDDERSLLIENIIDKKKKQLEKSYQDKLAEIDRIASQESLKHVASMALEEPDYNSFKIDEDIEINDTRINLYIDSILSYGDKYQVLLFEIENRSSKDITLNSINLGALYKGGSNHIVGSIKCPEVLKADSTNKCSYASTDTSMSQANELKIEINTDRGVGVFIW